jgi:hypothetical protein
MATILQASLNLSGPVLFVFWVTLQKAGHLYVAARVSQSPFLGFFFLFTREMMMREFMWCAHDDGLCGGFEILTFKCLWVGNYGFEFPTTTTTSDIWHFFSAILY